MRSPDVVAELVLATIGVASFLAGHLGFLPSCPLAVVVLLATFFHWVSSDGCCPSRAWVTPGIVAPRAIAAAAHAFAALRAIGVVALGAAVPASFQDLRTSVVVRLGEAASFQWVNWDDCSFSE